MSYFAATAIIDREDEFRTRVHTFSGDKPIAVVHLSDGLAIQTLDPVQFDKLAATLTAAADRLRDAQAVA